MRSYEASKGRTSDKPEKAGGQAFAAKDAKQKPKKKGDGKPREPYSKCGYRSHATADCKVDLASTVCLRCEQKGHTVAMCKVKINLETPPSSLAAEGLLKNKQEISFFAAISSRSLKLTLFLMQKKP